MRFDPLAQRRVPQAGAQPAQVNPTSDLQNSAYDPIAIVFPIQGRKIHVPGQVLEALGQRKHNGFHAFISP
jgi:hypothetical protein